MKNIGAIIVSHNNAQTITDCVQSLLRYGIDTIVVVDNNSSDTTRSLLTSTPSVSLLSNDDNVGFATAVNQAIKHESLQGAEYMVLLNPDATLVGSLDPAVHLCESQPRVGVVGLTLQDSQGNAERYSFGEEPSLVTLITRKFRTTPKVEWVSGGAMLVRTKAFQDVGGFDEQFFMYWEDIDLCRRLREKGWKIQRVDTIPVRHLRGGSFQDSSAKVRLYDSSADKYFKKHYPWWIWYLQNIVRFFYRRLSPHSL